MARLRKDRDRDRDEPFEQRQQRVGELVRHALAEKLLRCDLPDKDLFDHALFVAEVRMSGDLKCARVYITADSSLSDDAAVQKVVLAALRRTAAMLQRTCLAPLGLKFTPRLQFLWDEVPARNARLSELLREGRH